MSENKNVKLKYFGIPKLLPFVKPYKKIMISMIIMGALSSLIDSIYPLFNQYALNHFIALKTTDTIVLFIIVYIVILIVFVILNFVSTTWAGKIEMSVNRDLRNASFNHLQELSFSYFNQNNVGYVHARVMSDTGRIGQLVSWDMMDMVWQGSYLLFVLINMALINIHLAMYIMLIIPFAVILIIFFQKKLVALNRKIREINSKITSNFNEGITGAKSIKTLVVENKINHDFDVDSDDMEKTSVLAGRYSALFSSLVTMLSSITLAIILWKGGMINQEGIIMIGTLSVFMTYALNMLEPIQSIVGGIARLIAIQVNIERFTTLLETQSDVADRVEVVEKYGDTFHPKKKNWETLYGDVEFKDVSF